MILSTTPLIPSCFLTDNESSAGMGSGSENETVFGVILHHSLELGISWLDSKHYLIQVNSLLSF